MSKYSPEVEERLRREAQQIMDRYPKGHQQSALIPMLHLVQSEDGFVSADGIAFCAQMLELSRSEVSAVATFYTQFKRHPAGKYNVGICTNALCAVLGGDAIYEAVSSQLGIGTDETTEDGKITLEAIECNAACDYAPVVMVNWEFFDNQTPQSALDLVEDIKADRPLHPTRGPEVCPTFKENEHLLAGFLDGHQHEGPSAGEPSTLGLRIARQKGWKAPDNQQAIAAAEAERAKAEKDGEEDK